MYYPNSILSQNAKEEKDLGIKIDNQLNFHTNCICHHKSLIDASCHGRSLANIDKLTLPLLFSTMV